MGLTYGRRPHIVLLSSQPLELTYEEIDKMPKLNKTATMELTAFEWKIITIALNEASTMPNASKQLADEITELVAVQTGATI